MKNFILYFMTFVTSICVAQESKFSINEIVVELKADYSAKIFRTDNRVKEISDSLNLQSFTVIGNTREMRTYVLKFNNDVDVESVIKAYKKTNIFRYVEPNFIGKGLGVRQNTTNDQYYSRQLYHHNDATFTLSASTNDADIDTDLAWDITQGDPNIIVAILDTGIKLDHPEFAGRVVPGYDFAYSDTDPSDDDGHGTCVAAVALAKGNNAIGYAGINWNSKIMSCKVLNNTGFGYYTWWANAIYFAVDNGADVINMSVGGEDYSTLLEDAVNYAYSQGVCIVAATGNGNSFVNFPAYFENVIAVGSTDPNDTRSNPFSWNINSGSNYGPELDLVAPGSYIYTLSHNSDADYDTYWSGTSQAAPMVAGVISLMLSVNPALTPNQIRQILEQTAEDQVGDAFDTPGWDEYYGYGRINAFAALSSPLLSKTQYYTESTNIKIFPNPITAENSFYISGLNPSDHYDIKVVSLDGKVVKKSKNTSSNDILRIEMNQIPAGIYFVNIFNIDNKLTFNKKMVKN